MKLLLGIVLGILLTSVYPTLGDNVRKGLNTFFTEARYATSDSSIKDLHKEVDKLLN